jgi:sarcosine oxidase subunit alpha
VTPLWEGGRFTAVNTFGGLQRDRVRFLDRLGRFLPVGFYYKAFYRPRRLFPFWERKMRRMAGLGAVDPAAGPLRTPNDFAWCDVLVVGAGPAGLAAAAEAAAARLSVTLVDEQPRPGGSLLYQRRGDPSTAELLSGLLSHVQSAANIDLRASTVAAGYYADHWVALADLQRLTRLRARSVVLATGAFEQPALFRNNDLPGVLLASAAQRLIRLYAVKPCDRAVVLTANADGYRAALDMHQVGVQLQAIVDLRPDGEPSELSRQVRAAGIRVLGGHAVYEALSQSDEHGIGGVVVCPLDTSGHPRLDQRLSIDCDGLVMSVGWAPADSLFCQAGGKMRYDNRLEQFVPARWPAGVFTAGRLNGLYDLERQLADGRRAGQAAAAHLGCAPAESADPAQGHPVPADGTLNGSPPSHPYPVVAHPAGKIFVDLDEDVQLKDIEHSAQEGFDSIELLKRYSTFGMGPSQGKISNTNTARVLARLRGQSMAQTGSPRARPFFHPVPLGHLAGRGFHPRRLTPLHSRHRTAGAQFVPAGDWLRPAWYLACQPDGPAGETIEALRAQAIADEVRAVRQRAGLIDVGTLGKLEISGPDAAQFIERIYTGRFAGMKVGATRYALMCDESGVIIDDGVVARLESDRFYVTTTTTASGAVYREMQRWAILWNLDVLLTNLTGTMAAINLAGPQANRILAALTDLDLSEQQFPYLGLRQGNVLGVPARVLRTGFVGETSYELHVPAHWAARVWDGIMEAGRPHAIRPFGVEAQRILRLEKGHVIVSQDTDGLTTPFEAGLDWAIKADKPFFVGGRSLSILLGRPLKRRLAGFVLSEAYRGALPQECDLVIESGEIAGRVTSIAHSPTLRQAIGMAFLPLERTEEGTEFRIRALGGMVPATVRRMPFYDPRNLRQRA